MSGDEMLSLAERVEAAEGPDRELDRAIMKTLKLLPDYAADWGPRDNYRPAPFAYTSSLDAAMMLVPEGWSWSLSWLNTLGEAGIHLFRPDQNAEPRGKGATPALALTTASLRARASSSEVS